MESRGVGGGRGLQGCTDQQVARADLGGPVNLHVGNISFYMIKMRKDHTERKKYSA